MGTWQLNSLVRRMLLPNTDSNENDTLLRIDAKTLMNETAENYSNIEYPQINENTLIGSLKFKKLKENCMNDDEYLRNQ